MALNFEVGDPGNPRGHALIYFTEVSDHGKAAATYAILLPVTVDLKKYIPPFLAGQVEGVGAQDLSAFAFPPSPEPVQSVEWVRSLAKRRSDDLLFGGAASLSNTTRLMMTVGEIVAEYAKLYRENSRSVPEATASGGTEAPEGGAPVEDVVYSLMNEADLLGELATLMGRLRYAVEGGDRATASEALARVSAVARRLPTNRRIDRLAEVAADLAPESAELAQLYLERAYALHREDYRRVKSLDVKIEGIEGPAAG